MSDPSASITLQFLSNEAGEAHGLNEAGTEIFADDPFGSTARECGQNSADAGTELPVILRFDRVHVPTSDVDAGGALTSAIKSCLKVARADKDDKAIAFFQHAEMLMQKPELLALRIADMNTKGLKGPCEDGNPFHTLVKSEGKSLKDFAAGGSFGIGKRAAFAISDLRTVIYSTRYEGDDGQEQFLAQGKSLLMSHTDEAGSPKLRTGYWGLGGFAPIDDERMAPEWTHRSDIGMTLHSIGFRDAPDWQYRMAASLLKNFVVAIQRGDIEFHLDDGAIVIDSKSLGQLLEHSHIIEAAEASNQIEDLEYAKMLYQCLTSEEAKEKTLYIPDIGDFRFRILVREGLPKRLSIVRNGMVITDSLEHFGDKFRSFRMYRDFVAIVEPSDKDGREFIRKLENPAHNGLSAERVHDEEKRRKTIKAMKDLAGQIRAAVKSETLSEPDEVQALDELSRFFVGPDDVNPGSGDAHERDPANYRYTPGARRRSNPAPKAPGRGGAGPGQPGKGVRPRRRPGGIGPEHGDGEGGTGPKPRFVDLIDARNLIIDGPANMRRVWFTPAESGKLVLHISASGINSSEELSVSSTTKGSISQGRTTLEVVGGKREELIVGFATDYAGPIELVGYQPGAETSDEDQ